MCTVLSVLLFNPVHNQSINQTILTVQSCLTSHLSLLLLQHVAFHAGQNQGVQYNTNSITRGLCTIYDYEDNVYIYIDFKLKDGSTQL